MASNQTPELCVPYVTPEETYAVSFVLPGLSIIFVLVRMYTRALQRRNFGIDDWLIIPALVMLIGMGITIIIGVKSKAIGYPTPYPANLTPVEEFTYVNPTISLIGKLQYAFLPLFVSASGLAKLSVTCLYRRIFATGGGSYFDWITRVANFMLIVWTASLTIAFAFGCGFNFSANWGSMEDEFTYCKTALSLDSILIISGCITDMIVLVLPWPMIWQLHMTPARKFAVLAILATGSFSVAASIIKVIISFETANPDLNTDVDPNLTTSTLLFWSLIEVSLALIAACLPTYGPLLHTFSLPSVRSALSLESTPSHRSHRAGPYHNFRAEIMASSQTAIMPETGTVHSWSEGTRDTSIALEDGIYVSSQIEQFEESI